MPRPETEPYRGLACGARVGSADMMAERNGALRQARIRNRKTPTAPSVSGLHASETGKPRQDSRPPGIATGSAEPLLLGTFEPAKNKGGWVKQEALAGSRHWLGGRNGPEQNRAASAIPKARHSPQRHQ